MVQKKSYLATKRQNWRLSSVLDTQTHNELIQTKGRKKAHRGVWWGGEGLLDLLEPTLHMELLLLLSSRHQIISDLPVASVSTVLSSWFLSVSPCTFSSFLSSSKPSVSTIISLSLIPSISSNFAFTFGFNFSLLPARSFRFLFDRILFAIFR